MKVDDSVIPPKLLKENYRAKFLHMSRNNNKVVEIYKMIPQFHVRCMSMPFSRQNSTFI